MKSVVWNFLTRTFWEDKWSTNKLLKKGYEIPPGARFLDKNNNWWIVTEDLKLAPYYPKKGVDYE